MSSPAPTDIQETRLVVEEFFNYGLPRAVKDADHTKSDRTRPPQFFDRHLSEDLILKRVKRLPSMSSALKGIAADALAACTDLPSIPVDSRIFPTQDNLDELIGFACVKDESGIQTMYAEFVPYVVTVAATLELSLPEWGKDRLTWETMPTSGDRKAKADGFLRARRASTSGLSDDLKVVYEVFREIALWEFKNLLVGDKEHMKAVLNYARDGGFPWVGCEHGDDCGVKCVTPSGDACFVTGARTGLDSEEPQVDCSKSVTLAEREDYEPTQVMRNGAYILQQIWAEAVKEDATFLTLHAGPYEIIGIRSRVDQTLYLSSLIRTHKPGYGKLHTGLMIAAVRDARSRALRVLQSDLPLPPLWEKAYSGAVASSKASDGAISLQKRKVVLKKTPQGDSKTEKRLLFEQALTQQTLVIRFRRKEINLPFHPNLPFQRCGPPIAPSSSLDSWLEESGDNARIELTAPPFGFFVPP